jgi:superfamily II DNA/RNA helicase
MAIDRVELQQLRLELSSPDQIASRPFDILRELCRLVSIDSEDPSLQELVLLALEHRTSFGLHSEILDSVLREVGLFPYIDPTTLGTAGQLVYELHRPPNFDSDIIFHRHQAKVFRRLLAGKNIILSAPTSFGKSLIIDAIIATNKFKNILIIVPTIALIDETRRRLTRRFNQQYKVLTHSEQNRGERNIFVFTQERALEQKDFESIDFFVIDEFYKLAPARPGDDRAALLNQAFYRLAKTGAQFYMLGPNVLGVTEDFSERLSYEFMHEPFRTVVSEVHHELSSGDRISRLCALCKRLSEPTIIFCKSPPSASEVAKELVRQGLGRSSQETDRAASWLSQNYHPSWHFSLALKHGIGVHHGRIPRALGQYVVRLFNEGSINLLICTSTLIEGVNTRAKNIIIYDNTIDRQPIDFFTFNNIKGRSGRMGHHFVGHVYLFDAPPEEELPLVDVPAFTQSDAAATGLLIQLDPEDLTDRSKDRLRPLSEQEWVDYETLQSNIGVEPERQVKLAEDITKNLGKYRADLQWTGFPTKPQLELACSLIWKHFDGQRLGKRSVRSPKQLAFLLDKLKQRPTAKDLIKSQLSFSSDIDPDNVVQDVLDFVRLWATFHFPRLLRTLDKIQKDILIKSRLKPGSYELYAGKVESLFIDPAIIMLDEYGIPLEVARKLENWLTPNSGLDDALEKLKNLQLKRIGLSGFEEAFVVDTLRHA